MVIGSAIGALTPVGRTVQLSRSFLTNVRSGNVFITGQEGVASPIGNSRQRTPAEAHRSTGRVDPDSVVLRNNKSAIRAFAVFQPIGQDARGATAYTCNAVSAATRVVRGRPAARTGVVAR